MQKDLLLFLLKFIGRFIKLQRIILKNLKIVL
jgi:hypothetical protein